MKKLVIFTALIFAVSSLNGCSNEGKNESIKKKRSNNWSKKGTYTVNPELGKLH